MTYKIIAINISWVTSPYNDEILEITQIDTHNDF